MHEGQLASRDTYGLCHEGEDPGNRILLNFSLPYKAIPPHMLRLPIRIIQSPCAPKRVSCLLTRSLASLTMAPTPWIPKSYPPARRSDHVDTYKSAAKGEVRVADPYQWLEADTEETDKWTSVQEAFTRTHLDKNTDRQKLEDAFRASMDYAKVHDLLIPHRLRVS